MNTELNNRFFQKKLNQLLTNSTKPFPTMICEREDPEVTELVREFCLFSPHMSPLTHVEKPVDETLARGTGKVDSYGEIYILVNYN